MEPLRRHLEYFISDSPYTLQYTLSGVRMAPPPAAGAAGRGYLEAGLPRRGLREHGAALADGPQDHAQAGAAGLEQVCVDEVLRRAPVPLRAGRHYRRDCGQREQRRHLLPLLHLLLRLRLLLQVRGGISNPYKG